LEKLQAVNFAGVPFPFNEELGFAYRSAGQMDKRKPHSKPH